MQNQHPRLPLPIAALLTCAALVSAPLQAIAAPPAKSSVQSDDAPDIVTYGRREDVMRFAEELAARNELDPEWVKARLAEARYVPNVAKFIMPPPAGTAKNWAAYRSRFVEPIRLRAGVAFWRENEKWLKKAEELYGVPAEIVVGIIGVETIYGRQMGNFKVIDALATLSFDFPKERRDRSAFFRDELEQLFVLSRSEDRDVAKLLGSYAGAMGMGQFMPSSWNKFAVDFDGDGKFDRHRSAPDVIGSVAHYLAESGWQRGMPTRFAVNPPVAVADRAALLVPDILPTFTAQQFTERGAGLGPEATAFEGKLALVELQNGAAAPSYYAGTPNFYAVTRYNWSSYYAMAVIELGEEVARIRRKVD
jgi:membrane-bound lytic murein transglycosylase B